MKSVIIVLSAVFSLSGCINIKAPDNLVSDSVDVSKDIYNSVKDKFSKDDSNDEIDVFSYSYEIPDKEPLVQSSSKCMNAAIEEAKKSLNKYEINIKSTKSNLVTVGNKSILKCSVSI
ncbi:Putative uncharacterized protein [Moritella viscosa]|uniref:Lipoprotein n=2 Tax=Moritella viscosa TaxID=80854 RepID=A0A1L0F3F3_9GAMM|nr:hypothetical protein [Moritella viscosa]SGZ16071.1 Putative uncharacterized protein [Moritella viscosa]SHN98432.1 Ribosome maturation factor rimP [Moritella viscosa]SHO00303.1 Ribosome maturation factor rimP [Moritella viscosa]SHO18241.1 Ribosome maturation factor rimP [Moritella viscosa]